MWIVFGIKDKQCQFLDHKTNNETIGNIIANNLCCRTLGNIARNKNDKMKNPVGCFDRFALFVWMFSPYKIKMDQKEIQKLLNKCRIDYEWKRMTFHQATEVLKKSSQKFTWKTWTLWKKFEIYDVIYNFVCEYQEKKNKRIIEKYAKKLFVDLFIEA